jgi:hypothetical protein
MSLKEHCEQILTKIKVNTINPKPNKKEPIDMSNIPIPKKIYHLGKHLGYNWINKLIQKETLLKI